MAERRDSTSGSNRLVRANEGAQILGISRDTLIRLSNQGKVPYYRLGFGRDDRYYRVGDLEAFLAAARVEPLAHPRA